MDILVLLGSFFIMSTVVKIATDNFSLIMKPIVDVKKYKLIIAFAFTFLVIFGFNYGVLESLNIPDQNSLSWFKDVDLMLTSLFLTGGARGIHKLSDAWKEYNKKSGE